MLVKRHKYVHLVHLRDVLNFRFHMSGLPRPGGSRITKSEILKRFSSAPLLLTPYRSKTLKNDFSKKQCKRKLCAFRC